MFLHIIKVSAAPNNKVSIFFPRIQEIKVLEING
jgi:hypothetical protein